MLFHQRPHLFDSASLCDERFAAGFDLPAVVVQLELFFAQATRSLLLFRFTKLKGCCFFVEVSFGRRHRPRPHIDRYRLFAKRFSAALDIDE